MDCRDCVHYEPSDCRLPRCSSPLECNEQSQFSLASRTQLVKDDAGKLKMSLITWKAVRWIVRARMYGLKKYPEAENYRKVPEIKWFEAALRHLFAYGEGELIDQESGLPHLAHAITNLAYLIEVSLDNPTLEEKDDTL